MKSRANKVHTVMCNYRNIAMTFKLIKTDPMLIEHG